MRLISAITSPEKAVEGLHDLSQDWAQQAVTAPRFVGKAVLPCQATSKPAPSSPRRLALSARQAAGSIRDMQGRHAPSDRCAPISNHEGVLGGVYGAHHHRGC
jgi:hypothetical protein